MDGPPSHYCDYCSSKLPMRPISFAESESPDEVTTVSYFLCKRCDRETAIMRTRPKKKYD
jgi:hypothetical protein